MIDTDVLVVANGRANHAGGRCYRAAAKALRSVEQRSSLVLDQCGDFLDEYYRNLNKDRRPKAGDRFFRRAIRSDIRYVRLTSDSNRGYREFPSDPRLQRFDRNDRKFVAATLASGTGDTELVNAVDSDYSLYRAPLEEAGVFVNELCLHVIERARRS